MIKRVSTFLSLGAAVAAMVGMMAGPASASPVPGSSHSVVTMTTAPGIKPSSCQALNAQADLFLNSGSIWGYDCTGSVYPGVYAYRFDAGGWSGYIYWNGQQKKFCDWQSFTGSGLVTEIDFSPTRLSGC